MCPLLAGSLHVCFDVHVTGCGNATGSCCGILSSSFHKLAFLTSNSCMKSFSNITYNGDKKSHDVSALSTTRTAVIKMSRDMM
jgi:enoyl-[acyl-carrier-protein] reductase (NADH)